MRIITTETTYFLECEILNIDGEVHYKHWNKNKGLHKQKFYKGKSFYSVGPINQKRATISGTFTRIRRNCSNESLWKQAVSEKVDEYVTIGYPRDMVEKLCSTT